jgi:hypothetical protein
MTISYRDYLASLPPERQADIKRRADKIREEIEAEGSVKRRTNVAEAGPGESTPSDSAPGRDDVITDNPPPA